jgi:hypothetical protein
MIHKNKNNFILNFIHINKIFDDLSCSTGWLVFGTPTNHKNILFVSKYYNSFDAICNPHL